MTSNTEAKVIRKSLLIDRPQDVTYKLFTEEIGEWWPDGYSVAGPGSTTLLELHRGGRILQRSTTGQQFELGKIKVWSPPKRLVFTWQQGQWDGATEVEVTFTEEGNATRVNLEHRGWEKIGKWGEDFRNDYDIGWDDILPRFVSHSSGKRRTKKAAGTVARPEVRKPDQLSSVVKRVLANPPADGLLVHSIHGQAAKDAGIKEGDVIVSFAGTKVLDWNEYYKIHCSVSNSEVVPLVVMRGDNKVKLQTSRTWIAGSSAPLWELKKGQPVALRPKPTKCAFDLGPLGNGPLEVWYRHSNLQGKKIGYEHQSWRLEDGNVEFISESAYELMGLHHTTIRSTISNETLPKPIRSRLQDLSVDRTVDGKQEMKAQSLYWRSDISGEQEAALLVDLPKDAMLATLGHAICAFMTRKEGATWAWTPVDEYSGRVALPVATVCRGVEKLKNGRANIDAWRFDVIRVGRTLASLWVSAESGVIKVQSQGGVLVAVSQVEALKGVPPKLEPTIAPSR